MSFKSILTIPTDPETSASALGYAATLAQSHAGHLEALCLGIDRTQVGYYYASANALIEQETLEHARADAEDSETWARKQLDGSTFPWAADKAMVGLPGLASLVSMHARFSDIAVLPKPYGDGRETQQVAIVEATLFEGHTPVIVVPDDSNVACPPKRIVIAWNESPEALNAVRAALPLLKEADKVNIVVIDPPAHAANRSDPGGQLSQMLARHGVDVEISVLAKSMPRVTDVLLRHVGDINADMVVMGAYGHSRFREAILGGATRHMLERAQVPVFMAH